MFKRGKRFVRNSEVGFIDVKISVSAEEKELPRHSCICRLCHSLWSETRGGADLGGCQCYPH